MKRIETMISHRQIESALGDLIGWLDTWQTPFGGYNGFVTHRTEIKRMDNIQDTAWTQAAMIRGYVNLYKKSGEKRWLQRALISASLLSSRYNKKTSRILNTGHEDDRFQSLVHCALAVIALLEVAAITESETSNEYVDLSVNHIERYWIKELWNEDVGAFKFSEIDFYSLHENRFVVNFNAIAAEALIKVFELTKIKRYKGLAIRVGKWLLKMWGKNRIYNEALIEKLRSNEDDSLQIMPLGGFSYQFTKSQEEPDNYVVLYNGLSLRGFMALYRVTLDEAFVEIIRQQSEFILAMRDPESHFFWHTTIKGKVIRNPQFIAGAGMILVGLNEIRTIVDFGDSLDNTINAILEKKYDNGSYPSFLGKNSVGLPRRNSGGIVWEDFVATTNWNSQFFEFLTQIVEMPSKIKIKKCSVTIKKLCRRFFYLDSPSKTLIVSWWPFLSMGVFLYRKKDTKAKFEFYPMNLYSKIRKKIFNRSRK